MKPERWARIKETFDQVMDEPVEARSGLVHAACADDPEIEDEVMRLLAAHSTTGSFLDSPVADLHLFIEPDKLGPALQRGMILARRFEVRTFINAGGMGEVYEAWDADLSEAVALKTILPRIAANTDIIERFKYEVRHAREVSHPNICRVHELFCHEAENGERTWFLSMELLRGTTLLERIRRSGSLPPDIACGIAEQLVQGLEAAHARGLVHRDFKSANVILVEEDDEPIRAVITDFGLAIRNLPGELPRDMPGTGTPGYMAPEQERGDEVGPLADQYAYGIVLREMMTGSPARTPSKEKPSKASTARQSGYTAAWHMVIRRCTRPVATERFRDMSAVQSALFPPVWRRRRGWFIAAGLVFALGLAALIRRADTTPPAECRICDVVQMTPDTDKSESPSLSADGRFLAYSSDRAEPGNLDIFVQALPSGTLTRITRDSARDTTPSLSPDGKLVAYRSERGVGGIYLSETTGYSESRLLVAGGLNPKISPDGKSLLYWKGDPNANVESGKIFRIDLGTGTGEPQPVGASFADARNPAWSPDGQHILFAGCSEPGQVLPACFDWWVADIYGKVVAQTHAYAALQTQNASPARFTSLAWVNDQIIFSAVSETKRLSLAAIGVDTQTFRATGPSRWLLTGQGGDVDPSIATGDRIAFTRASGALHIWQLHGLDGKKSPAMEKVTTDTEVDSSPSVAEGGRIIVFSRGRSQKRSLVLRDVATGVETTVLNSGTPVVWPIVDSAGKWIAYQQTDSDGTSSIYAGQSGSTMKRICRNCTEPGGWFGGDKAFFFRDSAHSISLADPRTGQLQNVLKRPGSSVGDVSWSGSTSWLVMITSHNSSKQIEAIHLDPATGIPDSTAIVTTGEHDAPVHPRWFGNGKGIVYISKADGFLCLYGRIFHASTHTFGEPFALSHFHGQRDSIDDVEPRAFNLSADGDTVYLNLGEQKSIIEIAQLKM